ncbi:hypothetical protein Scep_003769 [Stephania cephalantha]|uniref:CRAL-TRIO domain-containing protein n=1 Tax=Stephania cephalantha TaxID=152367 RepID=A0AAP0PW27_9MAGN
MGDTANVPPSSKNFEVAGATNGSKSMHGGRLVAFAPKSLKKRTVKHMNSLDLCRLGHEYTVTAFSAEIKTCKDDPAPIIDSQPGSGQNSEQTVGQPIQDTRIGDESLQNVVSENWVDRLHVELEKQNFILPESVIGRWINEDELQRFFAAANGNFSSLLSSIKKTIRWRETYHILSSQELEMWSNLVFWHGYDKKLRPCLVIRLGLACSSLASHEKPCFAQAVGSGLPLPLTPKPPDSTLLIEGSTVAALDPPSWPPPRSAGMIPTSLRAPMDDSPSPWPLCVLSKIGLAISGGFEVQIGKDITRSGCHNVSQVEHGVLHLLDAEDPQITVLMDCHGLPPAKFPMQMMRSFTFLMQDHYPNRLGCFFIVRLPSVVRVIMQTFIQVLKPVTREKLRIEGKMFEKVLSENLQMVPSFLGGKCSCPKCSNPPMTNTLNRSKRDSNMLGPNLNILNEENSSSDELFSQNNFDADNSCQHILRTAIIAMLMAFVLIGFASMMYGEENPLR